MSDFLSWAIVFGGMALMYVVTHFSAEDQKRTLLWVVGLAGIALMIWVKGSEYMWTWLLAICWLGVLFFLDHRIIAAPPQAAQETSPTETDDGYGGGVGGKRRY